IAAEHRIDLAGLGILGKVDGVLIEVRSLAAGFWRGSWSSRGRSRGSGWRLGIFLGILDQSRQLLAQRFRLDLLPLLADIANDACESLIRKQRQDHETRADLSRAELERADGPGLGEEAEQRRAECRRARIASLDLIQAAPHLPREPRLIYAELLQDA